MPTAARARRIAAGDNPRARFIASLRSIMGDTRLLWLPKAGDGLATVSEGDARRVVTHAATPQGRLSPRGRGLALSFNGTTDRATVPDADALSFGTGTADSAFSVVVVANVTDTAADRTLIAKGAVSNNEYWFHINGAADRLVLRLSDQSASTHPTRTSDAAITQGAWVLLGATYSGVGGASPANGITLYQNGVAIASTANNGGGSYVAMENLAAAVEVGVLAGGAHFNGSMSAAMLCQKALTAADHAAISAHCRTYFGI